MRKIGATPLRGSQYTTIMDKLARLALVRTGREPDQLNMDSIKALSHLPLYLHVMNVICRLRSSASQGERHRRERRAREVPLRAAPSRALSVR